MGPQVEPPLSRTGFIILSIIMAIFTGPAVILNSTVIIVSLMYKQLRQPLNYALVNMAVADLGTAMTGGVLSVVNNAQRYFSFGRTGCVTESFAVSLFGISSLCTVALIAVERMFVTCKLLGHFTFEKVKKEQKKGASCANVIFLYVLCIHHWPHLIFIFLLQVSKMACLEGGAVAKGERKVASMMVLTFLTSWLPYTGLAMLVVYNPDVEIHPLVCTLCKYAVPFLLCGKEPWVEDEAPEAPTTVGAASAEVSPA
uniref:Parapinopsin b n=1 Tax=Mastacembelus armatus TaxID=205130 RepID=A0A7N9ATI3_9TELE